MSFNYQDIYLSKEDLLKQLNSLSTSTSVYFKTELFGMFSCSELVLLWYLKGY